MTATAPLQEFRIEIPHGKEKIWCSDIKRVRQYATNMKNDCLNLFRQSFISIHDLKNGSTNKIPLSSWLECAETDVKSLMDSNYSGEVIVQYAPVAERFWNSGCSATIRNKQIRLGGCWFDFDERFFVELPE